MDRPGRHDPVRRRYDSVADQYAARFADEPARKPLDRVLPECLVEQAPAGAPIADIGCGPADPPPTATASLSAAPSRRRRPADAKPVQRIAERVDRGLDEVVSDGRGRLRLGGRYQLMRNAWGVPGFVEGNALGLRIQH